MKRINLFACILAFCMAACQGTVDPENGGGTVNGNENEDNQGNPGNTDHLEGNITLYAAKDVIKADGAYASVLSVILVDNRGVEHDVTADVDIYYEGSDTPIDDPAFRTETEGEYIFYAVRGFDISNSVSVKAVKGVPDLPTDTDPDNTSFSHRMLLVQHTGNKCPNCPKMMDILKRIGSDKEYSGRYHHVASHSYNEDDAAFSSSAQTLSKALNLSRNYPMLTYDLTTDEGYLEESIKEDILSLSKEKAGAAIAASVAVSGNDVYANISIKSAVESKYRIAVWILEDNIPSPQSGATASWHNMHENCLRLMYGADKNAQIYGKHVGLLKAGESADMIAAMKLDPEWITENCKLLIIAVSGNGDYGLVNCTYCPIDGSVSYAYL